MKPDHKLQLWVTIIVIFLISGIASAFILLMDDMPGLPCKPGETWYSSVLPDVRC